MVENNVKCMRCKKNFNVNDPNLNTKIIYSRINIDEPMMMTKTVVCPLCKALYPVNYEVEDGK